MQKDVQTAMALLVFDEANAAAHQPDLELLQKEAPTMYAKVFNGPERAERLHQAVTKFLPQKRKGVFRLCAGSDAEPSKLRNCFTYVPENLLVGTLKPPEQEGSREEASGFKWNQYTKICEVKDRIVEVRLIVIEAPGWAKLSTESLGDNDDIEVTQGADPVLSIVFSRSIFDDDNWTNQDISTLRMEEIQRRTLLFPLGKLFNYNPDAEIEQEDGLLKITIRSMGKKKTKI